MGVANFKGAFVAIAALAVTACSCTSEGLELQLEPGKERAIAIFDWRSSDDVSGTMNVSLAEGSSFSGPYFKITTQTPGDQLTVLWNGWAASGDWQYWQPGPGSVEHYSGKILASLGTARGDRMRCRFRLAHPASGMSGGGEGKCQLEDGTTVLGKFPPARR